MDKDIYKTFKKGVSCLKGFDTIKKHIMLKIISTNIRAPLPNL